MIWRGGVGTPPPPQTDKDRSYSIDLSSFEPVWIVSVPVPYSCWCAIPPASPRNSRGLGSRIVTYWSIAHHTIMYVMALAHHTRDLSRVSWHQRTTHTTSMVAMQAMSRRDALQSGPVRVTHRSDSSVRFPGPSRNRLSSSTTLLPLFPLQTRVPHVSSPEKVETHRRMRELRLSIPSLFGAPSPGRDPTENLVRTITCICDSYVATRGSVFGPTTLVTEPLSPLTPQVQTDLIIGVCRAPAELLMSFGPRSPTRAHPSIMRDRSRAKPPTSRPLRFPIQEIMIGRQQR